MLARVPTAERRRVRGLDGVAPASDRRTSARTKRGHATDGGGRQTRQGRRVLSPAVRCVASLAVRHATAMQQRLDPALNGHQQRADIVVLSVMGTERHAAPPSGANTPSSTSA